MKMIIALLIIILLNSCAPKGPPLPFEEWDKVDKPCNCKRHGGCNE